MREKGIKTLLIVAHSQGATMSSYFLSRNPSDAAGFLAIGMNANQKDADINSAESLKKINIPVLDLYGSNDFARSVGDRGTSQTRRCSQYPVLPAGRGGANHFFDGMNEELLSAVVSWSSRF